MAERHLAFEFRQGLFSSKIENTGYQKNVPTNVFRLNDERTEGALIIFH